MHGSATLEEAAAELALLLPLRDLSLVSTTEYLTATVLSAIVSSTESSSPSPLRTRVLTEFENINSMS